MWIISLSYHVFSRSRGADKSDPKLHAKGKIKNSKYEDYPFYRPTYKSGESLFRVIQDSRGIQQGRVILLSVMSNFKFFKDSYQSVKSISRTPRCSLSFLKYSKYGRIFMLNAQLKTRTISTCHG